MCNKIQILYCLGSWKCKNVSYYVGDYSTWTELKINRSKREM